MSKTEHALDEPGLVDAPDDVFAEPPAETGNGADREPTDSDVEERHDDSPADDADDEADDAPDAQSDGAHDSDDAPDTDLPAPTFGFAPPSAVDSAAPSTGNGHGDDLRVDPDPDSADPHPADHDDPDLDDSGDDDSGADPELDPAVARSIQDLFDDDRADELPAPQVETAPGSDQYLDEDAVDDHSGRDESGDLEAASDEAGARESSADEPASVPIPGEALSVAAPDVLEALRRSDIDGPTVEVAPQDDDTAFNVRRPQRLRDYDPAPIPIPAKVPRLLGRKPRVRKVTRVVRHVDPWSVFKIAIVANLVLYVILLTSGVLLWNVASATGTVDNVERFFESFGWSSFEFNGGEIYHSAWIAGLFLVVGLTGAAVLLATLFNLITDLVGGMRFTVLEEEVVETRTSPMRRFVVRRPEPEVPAIDHDQSGEIVREAVVDDSGAIVGRTR